MASDGILLILEEEFTSTIAYRLPNKSLIPNLLEIALKEGIIQRTLRKFTNFKTVSFISLMLQIVSHESLCWTIKSLKKDEMSPTSKAI